MVNIPKLKNVIMMHLRSTRELVINITNCKGLRKLRATYHSVLSKYAETHEQCLLEALEISQEIGDKSSKAISYLKVGTVLESVGQLVKAKERYKKSLEINKEIDNKRGVAASCANLRPICPFHSKGRWTPISLSWLSWFDKIFVFLEKKFKLHRGLAQRSHSRRQG